MSEGLYVPEKELLKGFIEALDKFEGVFQMETDPRRVKENGILIIKLSGVPKE